MTYLAFLAVAVGVVITALACGVSPAMVFLCCAPFIAFFLLSFKEIQDRGRRRRLLAAYTEAAAGTRLVASTADYPFFELWGLSAQSKARRLGRGQLPEDLRGLPLFGEYYPNRVEAALRGPLMGRDVVLFDYWYDVSSGRNRTTKHRLNLLAVRLAEPELAVRVRSCFDEGWAGPTSLTRRDDGADDPAEKDDGSRFGPWLVLGCRTDAVPAPQDLRAMIAALAGALAKSPA